MKKEILNFLEKRMQDLEKEKKYLPLDSVSYVGNVARRYEILQIQNLINKINNN